MRHEQTFHYVFALQSVNVTEILRPQNPLWTHHALTKTRSATTFPMNSVEQTDGCLRLQGSARCAKTDEA
jgi:hypothetical protein